MSSLPMDAAVMPFPSPLITPPVTTMYLIFTPSGAKNKIPVKFELS
jgi:hypothetical protein